MNNEVSTIVPTAKLSNKEILDQIAKLTAEKHARREVFIAAFKKAEAEYVQWRETEYRKQREALLKMLSDNHDDRVAKREERKAERAKKAEEKKQKAEAPVEPVAETQAEPTAEAPVGTEAPAQEAA